jgi:copper transport outer membrane protein MctB
MFDFRYHALSLAAVLLALAIGVLLGVAIGDSNLVSSAKQGIVAGLRGTLSSEQAKESQLRTQLDTQSTFENELLPLAVNGELTNRQIGLVFLGGSSDQVDSLVRTALAPTGAQLGTVGVVHEPLSLPALAAVSSGTRYAALASGDPSLISLFGQRVGVQLVSGGPYIARVRDTLLSAFDGTLERLDGVVVYRADPSTLQPADAAAENSFETGLIQGITSQGVPVVGVELNSTNPSQIPWYKSQGMSSVDDLDDLSGRAALVYALAGRSGNFGVKPTADSVVPQVSSSVTAATTTTTTTTTSTSTSP